MMTPEEIKALEIILGMADEIVVNDNYCSLNFDGDTYNVTEDGETVFSFDTIEELVEHINTNGLM